MVPQARKGDPCVVEPQGAQERVPFLERPVQSVERQLLVAERLGSHRNGEAQAVCVRGPRREIVENTPRLLRATGVDKGGGQEPAHERRAAGQLYAPLVGRDGLIESAEPVERPARVVVGQGEDRFHLDRAAVPLERLLVEPDIAVRPAVLVDHHGRQRIDLQRALPRLEPGCDLPVRDLTPRKPLMRLRAVRVQLDRLP